MHRLLEDYLSEVSVLLDKMPASRRAEELREMRAHLQDASAAGLEHGASDEDAVRDILNQFGSSDAVASDVMSAWRRERAASRRDLWSVIIGYLVSSFLLHMVPFIQHIVSPGPSALGVNTTWKPQEIGAWEAGYPLMLCVLFGWIFPRRAAFGVAAATVVGIMQDAYGLWFASQYLARHGSHLELPWNDIAVSCVASIFIHILLARAVGRLRMSLAGRTKLAHQ